MYVMTLIHALIAGSMLLPQPSARSVVPELYALEYVCEALIVDCTGIDPPTIRYAELRVLVRWEGYYAGTDEIWLDVSHESFSTPQAWEVVVHETAHYVDYQLGLTDRTSCKAEQLAWSVSNLWLVEHGHADMARWNWRDAYGCR